MIVDTSAIVAVLKKEPDYKVITRTIQLSSQPKISSGSYVELGIVLDRSEDPRISRELDSFIRAAGIEIVAFTPAQARLAREAYRDFGRGSGHPARLNFGDCFSYALAKELGEPLLFKGNDFLQTDVEPALPQLDQL